MDTTPLEQLQDDGVDIVEAAVKDIRKAAIIAGFGDDKARPVSAVATGSFDLAVKRVLTRDYGLSDEEARSMMLEHYKFAIYVNESGNQKGVPIE